MNQSKHSRRPNGFILWESPTVVAIATGFSRKSKNAKTGNMIQTWFLLKSQNPVTAVKDGSDKSICGDCPLGGGGGCYVNTAKAPLSVWKAYNRGNYPILSQNQIYSLFHSRFVRFGSYGEPTLLPIRLIQSIANASAGWTGYTHRWQHFGMQAYSRYLMASCDTADYEKAQAHGWRTFTVSREHLDNQIQCPASKERGHKLDCNSCGLCAGKSVDRRSVQIRPHGFKSNKIAA